MGRNAWKWRAALSIELPDARHLSDEPLQVLRLRALRGIELGYSEVVLADVLGVCHEPSHETIKGNICAAGAVPQETKPAWVQTGLRRGGAMVAGDLPSR